MVFIDNALIPNVYSRSCYKYLQAWLLSQFTVYSSFMSVFLMSFLDVASGWRTAAEQTWKLKHRTSWTSTTDCVPNTLIQRWCAKRWVSHVILKLFLFFLFFLTCLPNWTHLNSLLFRAPTGRCWRIQPFRPFSIWQAIWEILIPDTASGLKNL